MKRVSIAVTVLVALTLTGCAGTGDDAGDKRPAPSASESAAPLVAETTEAPDAEASEALFVEKFHEMRADMAGESQIEAATDAQLVASGWQACELIRSGTSPDAVRLVEGEEPNGADVYADSSALMNAALLTLCPELI